MLLAQRHQTDDTYIICRYQELVHIIRINDAFTQIRVLYDLLHNCTAHPWYMYVMVFIIFCICKCGIEARELSSGTIIKQMKI